MGKYCLRLDRPMGTSITGEPLLTGCDIYGVHHNCESCPNLTEMGEGAFVNSAKEDWLGENW